MRIQILISDDLGGDEVKIDYHHDNSEESLDRILEKLKKAVEVANE